MILESKSMLIQVSASFSLEVSSPSLLPALTSPTLLRDSLNMLTPNHSTAF